MRENKDFKFDKMASSYVQGFGGKLSKRFYDLLLSQVELRTGSAVLDVGCGTGTILKRMSEREKINGNGIDVENKMIAEAKQKCPDMNFIVSDCAKTPFEDRQFDLLTACMAYHHFADKNGFAEEAARILKPGGYLYIADPRFPWMIRKPLNLALRVHKVNGHFETPDEITDLFQCYGFEAVDLKYDLYAQCVKLRKAS